MNDENISGCRIMLSVAYKPIVVMLNVVMLNVVMLNVIMLNVVMLNVVMLMSLFGVSLC